MVMTGIIPIHLLAAKKAEVEQAREDGKDIEVEKKEARGRAMARWQTEWDECTVGCWTYTD